MFESGEITAVRHIHSVDSISANKCKQDDVLTPLVQQPRSCNFKGLRMQDINLQIGFRKANTHIFLLL